MPDFIANHIFVTGLTTELRTFRRSHFVPNMRTGRIEFDFGSFLPLPDILRDIKVDSQSDLALIALGAEPCQAIANPWTLTFDRVLELDWVKAAGIHSRQQLLTYLEMRASAAVLTARKRIAAFQETGHYDGHSWCLANWGTKWGPSSTSFVVDRTDLLEFTFCTPWCFPEPAFRRLGLLYPELCFDLAARNPDRNTGVLGHVLGNIVSLEPVDETAIGPENTGFDEEAVLLGGLSLTRHFTFSSDQKKGV